jgi:outer membrane protein
MKRWTTGRWTLGLLVGVGAVLGLAASAAADYRIAVVDMQRALNECDAGKKAKEQVRAKFEHSQEQLKRQQQELERLKGEYDKKAVVVKEDERRSLEKDLEARTLEYKRKYEDFQRELKQTDGELTQGIVEEIYDVVRDFGERNGYSLVLEASSGVLYSDKAVDVTEEVVKLHNASPHRAPKRGGKE